MSTANERIFYACQAVAIANHGTAGDLGPGNLIHGVQSVGITTNFNLEQAFELGQIEIYENIEGTPDVEVTLEKVLDGYPLIYHMASTGVVGTNASGLVARSKSRADVRLGIFSDAYNSVSLAAAGDGFGSAETQVYCSGMYIQSISYTLPVDGSSTESVTLVGNNKQWFRGANNMVTASVADFDGNDEPLALGSDANPSGGIQQREDVIIASSILPAAINGIVGSGYGNGTLNGLDTTNRVHLQNVSISTDFAREDILELGRKTPYARPATFPIEVSCEIEAVTTSGDFVNAYEFGEPTLYGTKASGNNTSEEDIFFYTRAGYAFDLGSKNRLASVSYGGGDAAGGNATCTYSYTNFNDLDVQNRRHGYCGFEFLKGTLPYGTVAAPAIGGG
jgi:hypothetical protein